MRPRFWAVCAKPRAEPCRCGAVMREMAARIEGFEAADPIDRNANAK
jgi:hypothetical protein